MIASMFEVINLKNEWMKWNELKNRIEIFEEINEILLNRLSNYTVYSFSDAFTYNECDEDWKVLL